jgi:pimeloyl-ACP methyl ester carboxylesterase
MPAVVCVPGVGQQLKGEDVLHTEWAPALRDGVRLAGGPDEVAETLCGAGTRCASYGDLFRPPGRPLGVGDPWFTAADATDYDRELLLAWWQEAADTDPNVIDPGARTLIRTPSSVQVALRALSGSRFFAGLADRGLLFDLQQVRRYLTEPELRAAARERVAAAVSDDTRVLVGHSLGSVVAYEALCAHPEWPVRALVTLGSPLGVRNLVFDRLQPRPAADGSGRLVGRWPGGVAAWTNIADDGDVVALEKDLRPWFGDRVACHLVDNGSHAHTVRPYLTAVETGAAILAGLTAPAKRP